MVDLDGPILGHLRGSRGAKWEAGPDSVIDPAAPPWTPARRRAPLYLVKFHKKTSLISD